MAHNPSIDHIIEKSKHYGYIPIKETELKSLKEVAESPDLEHITSKAKVHGYVPVKQTDFETLKTLAHKPDLDHIIEKSKSLWLHTCQRSGLRCIEKIGA